MKVLKNSEKCLRQYWVRLTSIGAAGELDSREEDGQELLGLHVLLCLNQVSRVTEAAPNLGLAGKV